MDHVIPAVAVVSSHQRDENILLIALCSFDIFIASQSTCKGCFSMYCKDCNEQQSHALKEVEELLTRLETAEALYPSTQVMAAFYPVYKCEAFVGRVKAMCLWYNITRHLRLKLIILGKLLAR